MSRHPLPPSFWEGFHEDLTFIRCEQDQKEEREERRREKEDRLVQGLPANSSVSLLAGPYLRPLGRGVF